MASRGMKLTELALHENLNLPKHDTTKGTSNQERATFFRHMQDNPILFESLAVEKLYKEDNMKNAFEATKDTSNKERESRQIRRPLQVSRQSEDVMTSHKNDVDLSDIEEPFQSSGSEYLPSSSDESVETLLFNSCTKEKVEKQRKQQLPNTKTMVHDSKLELESKKRRWKKSKATDHDNKICEQKTKSYLDDSSASDESEIIPTAKSIVIKKSRKVKRHKQMKLNEKPHDDEVKENEKNDTDSDLRSDEEIEISVKEIEIRHSKKHPISGKRMRHKKHCCFICHSVICNLPRHLEKKHGSDCEVARILAIPKCDKKRRIEFGKFQRRGDFYHNCEVLKLKKGELILIRIPTEYEKSKYSFANYGPCPDCLGFMLKKHIGIHIKKGHCPENSLNKTIAGRKPIAESNALVNGIQFASLDTEFMENIIDKMRDDEISTVCKNDDLIMRLGSMIFEKYHTSQSELVRQYMRQLGRLILQIKQIHSHRLTLSELLDAKYFDLIVAATKSLCEVQKRPTCRPEFNTPSLGLKIGHNLKRCASIARGIALRNGNLKRDKQLVSFLTLMELEWSIKISSNALNTLHKRKFNTTELLPLTTDLVKLNKYLDEEIQKSKNELEKSNVPLLSTWTTFASLLLARIVLFNKRRSGEASKMKITQYMMRPLWENQTTDELKSSLSSFEQELAKRLVVVEIEGKRGRKVPILLTPAIKSGIDLLLKTRPLVGINKENPFIFARTKDSILNLRGHDAIRKFAEKANLQSPENICGTKLRKYIATVCQIFNLTENETDWLARHLGHDIRVHREFYRLHENAVELTKVSRILLAVDKGEANVFAGKQLKDIELNELPLVEEDHELQEESDDGNEIEKTINSEVEPQSSNLHESEPQSPNLHESELTQNIKSRAKPSNNKNIKKVPWTTEETEAVLVFFRNAIKEKKVPGKEKCEECIEKNKVLCKRKWKDIKYHVKNYLDKLKKTRKN